jgi:hypothetical protein
MRDSRVDPAVNRARARRGVGLWLAALSGMALCSAGCDEKKAATAEAPSAEAGAATDKYATADPKLAKALQAAASAASAGGDKGPPPEGIFAPGVADARHPKGAPTTFEVVSDGAEPRVTLAPQGDGPPTGWYGPAVLQLMTQAGPRVVLPVDFGLALGPGKKDEGGADWLVADVKKTALGKEQMSELPPGTDKEVSALAGVSIQIKVTPDGRASEIRPQLGKAAQSDLARIVNDASEALLFATVPLPAKPVGVGAQWIAETRMPLTGLDTVVYRAYRVKDAGPDRVRLSLDAKAYAAGKEVHLQGVPAGATLEQFEAQISGEIELVRGEALARKSQLQERVILVLAPAGGAPPPQVPGQPGGGMMTAQLQNQALFVRGDDLRVTAKQP